MSLGIDVNAVTAVLLADGWHNVTAFYLDAYEYVEEHPEPNRDPFVYLAGGQCPHITSTGFTFTDDIGATVSGPLTSILAVRTTEPGGAGQIHQPDDTED